MWLWRREWLALLNSSCYVLIPTGNLWISRGRTIALFSSGDRSSTTSRPAITSLQMRLYWSSLACLIRGMTWPKREYYAVVNSLAPFFKVRCSIHSIRWVREEDASSSYTPTWKVVSRAVSVEGTEQSVRYLPVKPHVVVKVMSVLLTSIVMTWRRHDSILERFWDTEMVLYDVISIFRPSTRTSRQCIIPDEPFHRLHVLPRMLAQLQRRLYFNLLLLAHVLHGGDLIYAKLW